MRLSFSEIVDTATYYMRIDQIRLCGIRVRSRIFASKMPSIDDSKCVLITGATSGIGRALAQEILKLPSKPQVIGTGRRKDRLEELSAAGIEPLSLDMLSSKAAKV